MLPTKISTSIKDQARRVLEKGSRFDRFDQIRQRHFWSVYQFNPDANGYIGAAEYKVFLTPDGQNGQGFPSGIALSALETNFKGTGRVPDNENLSISELGVTLALCPLTTITDEELVGGIIDPCVTAVAFFQNTLAAITYLTNTVELGFVEDFSQPAGPQVGNYFPIAVPGVQPPTYVSPRFVTNGFSGPGLRRRFKIPIMLGHGETFNFSFLVDRSYFVGDFVMYARFDTWATESFVEKS